MTTELGAMESGVVEESATLDPEQARVVDHRSGALLVLGGPGTGKTHTLERRFLRLADEPRLSPDRVLFLVPNRAQKIALGDGLTRRLLDAGRSALIEVPIYTWHGFANHLVTRHYEKLGYDEPPVLLTSPEHWGSVREALAGENEANWPHHRHLLRNRGFVDEVVDFLLRVEQRLLEDRDLDRLVDARPQWASLVTFAKRHRRQLRARARIDYPTLLRDAVDLIANFEDVRESLHRRFPHLIVDDGQELSLVQQRLLSFLTGTAEAGSERSLVVAADPDSAIEHFRGADPAWLDHFATSFGSSDRVVLPRSYRLSADVGERALAVVAPSGARDHHARDFLGDTRLEVHRFANVASELESVARALRLAHLRDGIRFEDMAILLTSPRSMLPALERALQSVEVPYSLTVPDRPLEREGIVHALCELGRFAYRSETDDEQVVELLRGPLVGLATTEVRELERAARTDRTSLLDHLEQIAQGPDCDRRVAQLLELRDALRSLRSAPADGVLWELWERSDALRELADRTRRSLSDPANRVLDALVAFARALGRFVERRRGRGTFEEYLDAVARADFGSDPWLPPEKSSGGVDVLSFHAAKGRQWDVVCVCGVVEGAIPKGHRSQGLFDPYSLEETSASERARRNEAEDRRVFYVAVTRARRRCIVTTSPGPSRKGEPSRFLAELAGELPEEVAESERPPLTLAEAAARSRRVLMNPQESVAARLAALATVARIHKLDPACSAALPSEWWWRWDWTEGNVPINDATRHDEAVPEGKLRTSYSRISNYEECPLLYLCSVVLGLDPDVTHNLHFGRWIHEIIEDCEKDPSEDKQRLGRRRLINADMVFARFEELFDPTVFPNTVVARQFHSDGRTMLRNYIDRGDPGKAFRAEHTFRVDLDGHVIAGRIDRVDKRGKNLIVSDYKTSRSELGWQEAKDSLQLAIYFKAAKEDPELSAAGEPCSMQLVYPMKVVKNDLARRCQTPQEAEKVLERLPGLITGVLNEDFAPSPEADCRWCKFKPLCPLWSEGRELQP